MDALEDENKELKRVFYESKEKDLVIKDKEEVIDNLLLKIEEYKTKVIKKY